MFDCLFACLFAEPIFTEFGGKVAYGPLKNPVEFGGNSDHVTSGLDRVRVTVDVPPRHTRQNCVTVRCGQSHTPQH